MRLFIYWYVLPLITIYVIEFLYNYVNMGSQQLQSIKPSFNTFDSKETDWYFIFIPGFGLFVAVLDVMVIVVDLLFIIYNIIRRNG